MIYEWNNVPWRTIEAKVFKLQVKIYKLSKKGNKEEMYRVQETLCRLPAAKLLSVRKVTQDNRGKNTPGVDGVKQISPEERVDLASKLHLNNRSDPIRRIWIPKPNAVDPNEKRPLGIPTIRDRAKQALALLALEPQWEAVFEPNSYGFRPGRSCHDAIAAIYSSINRKSKWVLDADISKCFDRINHSNLLEKIDTYPVMRKQVKAWLKAGILDGKEFLFPTEGTPQGGVISPLLANIALHGMENFLKDWIIQFPYRGTTGQIMNMVDRAKQLTVVRYADDFVVMHPDSLIINKAKKKIEEWLTGMNLELKPSKTRIIHTHIGTSGVEPGCEFLSFKIRQYGIGKYQRKKMGLPFKTLIKPSKRGIKTHLLKIKKQIYKTKDTGALVRKLGPIIRGWSNYQKHVVSSRVFTYAAKQLMIKLMAWGRRKHRKRSKTWIYSRYLQRVGNRLRFGFMESSTQNRPERWIFLKDHTEVTVKRHVKVKGDRSPYDGDWVYWAGRGRNTVGGSPAMKKLLNKQKGRCTICNLFFKPDDIMEIDHIQPQSRGGARRITNLQLVHGHCHQSKSSLDKRKNGDDIEDYN